MTQQTSKSRRGQQWVATETFVNEERGMFYEEGGIYAHRPENKAFRAARRLEPDEPEAVCARCGQRFVATVQTPEANRDLHYYGDEDCPSICRDMACPGDTSQAEETRPHTPTLLDFVA
jgi:hypothetical protein